MTARSIVAVFVVALAAAACAAQEDATGSDGTWVGTVTTEGDVTTVVNESGSVWGKAARLVEEASIGVESGHDAYMLGQISAVWATEDRIFVVDWQVPAVRVFDFDGTHLFDLGRQGQGPGEFELPVDIAVTEDGDILMIERNVRGRTWFMRERSSRELSACGGDTATCWISGGYDLDAFEADGRYLGSTTFLADLRDVTVGALDGAPAAPIFIDGDTTVAVVSDAAGTIMVKRYRLVLPGEE